MANSIAYAQKFLPVIDDIYKASSVTACLDTPSADFGGANEIKVLKVSTTGLGDYSRSSGYPKGDVTAQWETMKLSKERGKEISIDRMDDEETLGMVFGSVTGSFMKDHVVPELDAYRLSKYAGTSGITSVSAKITKDNVIETIDAAMDALDAEEVPEEGRVLFVSAGLRSALNQAINRQWGSERVVNTVIEGYNGTKVIYVPKTRFYTKIDLNDGSEDWGYTKNASGADINFMLIHPSAVVQAEKFALPKIFTPDQNQKTDSWLFQFRLYHDAFVYENKAKGVYVSTAAGE